MQEDGEISIDCTPFQARIVLHQRVNAVILGMYMIPLQVTMERIKRRYNFGIVSTRMFRNSNNKESPSP